MKLFNTMTRQKEEFVPITPGEVKMYCCGPTVYNYIHVGNARPMILFDVLRRYLEYRGYQVTFVQNFTDVDDKIINRANEEGTTSQAISEKYIEEYFKDAHGLGVRDATIHPKATENIAQIIDLVQTLIDKGYAYAVNGDVYYRTKKFADYGKLSHQPIEDLQAGARIDVNDVKEDPLDFALWKAAKPGEPYLGLPLGPGPARLAHRVLRHVQPATWARPSTSTAAARTCSSPTTRTRSPSPRLPTASTFVNYWMHNGFINIDNQKMSKSLGNFFTVREAAEAYGYEAVRFFMLSAQYRSPLNYSRDSLIMAQNSLERLYTAESNLEFLVKNGPDGDMTPEEKAFTDTFDTYREKFDAAMDDDLNTADAISVIFELVRAINIAVEKAPTKALAQACLDMLHEFTDVLGLLYNKKEESLDETVEAMIRARQAARKAKNFAEADRIRDELKAMGITLMDTPQGVKWSKD